MRKIYLIISSLTLLVIAYLSFFTFYKSNEELNENSHPLSLENNPSIYDRKSDGDSKNDQKRGPSRRVASVISSSPLKGNREVKERRPSNNESIHSKDLSPFVTGRKFISLGLEFEETSLVAIKQEELDTTFKSTLASKVVGESGPYVILTNENASEQASELVVYNNRQKIVSIASGRLNVFYNDKGEFLNFIRRSSFIVSEHHPHIHFAVLEAKNKKEDALNSLSLLQNKSFIEKVELELYLGNKELL